MHFTFCPHCGLELILKEIGDEGRIPYCTRCSIPLWDLVTPCIICAVVCKERQVALLRQNYVSADSYVCVAGVMKLGESAEDTACREVQEEIGLKVEQLQFIRTYPFLKKEMLMIGYQATVQKKEMVLSGEVDRAQWFPVETALGQLRQGSIAWQLVKAVIENFDAAAGKETL